MRSNGRHRRPRQVPAIVVTAGVAGSALALPLLAATNASAADTSTWDKVAECESGGAWSANFGSGAYGGLQFTQEEWQNAGGTTYAERADLASRSQQIAVAERVLASQGPEAWPLCASPAGLTKEGPSAEVDPGRGHSSDAKAVSPSPSRPDDSVPSTGSGAPSTDFGAPTQSVSPSGSPAFGLPDVPMAPPLGLPVMPDPDLPSTAPTTPGDPTTSPTTPVTPGGPTASPTTPVIPGGPTASPTTPGDPTAPVTPGTSGTPGIPSAPDASADPSATPQAPAAGTSEGSGKHRGTPAVEAPVTPDAASDPTYIVKEGDSLAAIADAKGVKGGWSKLYEANEQVIGGDANLIKPGQNLDLTKQ
ncbi:MULTISPECIES: transglycosylase family protein [unclassified Streptomyces]|uniref:LysM peptidoglycan-binding domain-containing protein n=1 Tax=unclassified Streptomyces TaxID=2593676 RepID=UPI001BECF1E5|nr:MULTISPECIES: transglycosylase family protein [unclassified Streptomyces]MBT2404508.1 transglycosylase family protein [Streptomyces sp. ISL-21]MBT2608799.1 transglycosylase family protein [Streptomyces sp. ISL-87]